MNDTMAVTVKGNEYQISRFDARVGSWIAMQIWTKVMPFGMDSQITDGNAPARSSEMSESEFRNIQDHCLRMCSRIQKIDGKDLTEPVVVRGNIAIPDLQTDTLSVITLTLHVLMFNVKDFFDQKAVSEILGSLAPLQNLGATT